MSSVEKKLTAAERERQESLDRKIGRLEEKIFTKKKEYEDLLEELHDLQEERYPERKEANIKEALYRAYQKSSLSLDEAVQLLEEGSHVEW